MQHQDWQTVYIKKEKRHAHDGVSKKPEASEDVGNVVKPKLVSDDIAAKIRTLRQQKQLTQAQLAQMANVKPDVINSIESKKAVHNGQLFANIIKKLENYTVVLQK